jgi:hypothetical protein
MAHLLCAMYPPLPLDTTHTLHAWLGLVVQLEHQLLPMTPDRPPELIYAFRQFEG